MDGPVSPNVGSAALQGILGYLNFSAGKPDPRFQKQFDEAFAAHDRPGTLPWLALRDALLGELDNLHHSGARGFGDVTQARSVLALLIDRLLPAYREHHRDLLFHQGDHELFQPGFLIRAAEAVLAEGAPWDEHERVVRGALTRLNDYLGYRPIAVLETRPRGEPYPHERLRAISLYLRGVGALHGPYRALIARALELLEATDRGTLDQAYFDPELLDELAFDPRGYDHCHPADRRPNYRFGEWDPHHIDGKGRYRRFVVRQLVLDSLLHRVEQDRGPLAPDEALHEAAIVLAGTVLMASAVSGSGPDTHDSTVTLSTLVPKVARGREAFYALQLARIGGAHRKRLDEEAAATRQPFGGVRQHINQFLARHRAAQLQNRHLSLLMAEMGYPEASRRQAAQIPVPGVRVLSEMHIRLTTGNLLVERGELAAASALVPEVEDLLHRGIGCGAILDPWNILGYQGLYPLFTSAEDSTPDPRAAQLIHLVEQTLNLYARVVSEAAASGDAELGARALAGLRKLASWWDRFATMEVGDVRHVSGGEAAASAEHVGRAMAHWHERGEAASDLAFWRKHLDNFRTPKAFALVIDALLRKRDHRAAMALVVSWLAQAEQVPLEDGAHSFHAMALRWMLAVAGPEAPAESGGWALLVRFLDYLEANADEYWKVPSLEFIGPAPAETDEPEEEEGTLYGAAYEHVTFRDSTDDGVEGEVADSGGPADDFDLEEEGQRMEKRLRFHSTLARLWYIATRCARAAPAPPPAERDEPLRHWLAQARKNYHGLLSLLDAVHEHPVPEPTGSYDSVVEYERRRLLKEQLLNAAIMTCRDTAFAVGALQGAVEHLALPAPAKADDGKRPPWEPVLMRLEQALWRGDGPEVRQLLPGFIEQFRHEPLLFTPLAGGGHPRQLLRVGIAQTILGAIVSNLPRLGLLRETYEMLRTAWAMEKAQPLKGPRVTEFDRLFQVALQAVVETVVDAAARERPATPEDEVVAVLERVTEPFANLWLQHSRTLRVSALEGVGGEGDWKKLREFIRRYGGDLFTARFMTLANLRGILHRGVGAFLHWLEESAESGASVKLVEELEREITRPDAERWLHIILQAIVENYEEYKDYNTTTPQSDYGQNLHTLFDFLRLKAGYERDAWQRRPEALVHDVLARRHPAAAVLWQEQVTVQTRERAEEYARELAKLEKQHGMRLRTVADRLNERFVKPLALDRLAALIEPAMAEARGGSGGEAFARFEQELADYGETTTGVGLDVPAWLRRLEAEVHRVQTARTAIANLAENLFQIARVAVPLSALRRQFDNWPKPRP